ncbi:hypothetical protein MTO96_005916 [Rhipicephalus appendiculatus]
MLDPRESERKSLIRVCRTPSDFCDLVSLPGIDGFSAVNVLGHSASLTLPVSEALVSTSETATSGIGLAGADALDSPSGLLSVVGVVMRGVPPPSPVMLCSMSFALTGNSALICLLPAFEFQNVRYADGTRSTYWDVVDDTKDPCDDFYAHVCNPRRWYFAGRPYASRPFPDFSTAQLLEDTERFFRYFVELRGKPVGDNFLVRMMWVYDACKRDTGAKLNASAELADIFEATGLSGVVGLDNTTARSIARMIATGDKHLRLHPLFKVHVLGTGPLKASAGYDIVLSAPETPYRRFVTRFPGSTDSQYVDLVARALTLYSATTTQAIARQVMLLERRLERMMLASEEQMMMPPREKYVSLEHLFLSERWDWSVYFNTLFENTGESVSNDTEVFVNDPVYFRSLGAVMTAQWEPIIPKLHDV